MGGEGTAAQLERPAAQRGVRGRRGGGAEACRAGRRCKCPQSPSAAPRCEQCCGLAAHRWRTHLPQREPP